MSVYVRIQQIWRLVFTDHSCINAIEDVPIGDLQLNVDQRVFELELFDQILEQRLRFRTILRSDETDQSTICRFQ